MTDIGLGESGGRRMEAVKVESMKDGVEGPTYRHMASH